MYDMQRIDSKEWSLLVDNKPKFIGSLKDVCDIAVGIGFNVNEITDALEDMAWLDHDSIHFGIYKGYLYSYNKENK